MNPVLAYVVPICAVIACAFLAALVSTRIAEKKLQKIPSLLFLGLIFCVSMPAGWATPYLLGFMFKASHIGLVGKIVCAGIVSYAVTLAASILMVSLLYAPKQGKWAVMIAPWGAISLILFSFVYVPMVRKADQLETRLTCVSYLRQLALAAEMYSNDYSGYLPKTLNMLYPYYVPAPQLFVCPGAHRRDVSEAYEYDPTATYGNHVPMIWDSQGNHAEGRNVVFRDGQLEWLDEQAFQKLRSK